jgi:hypothetical protein
LLREAEVPILEVSKVVRGASLIAMENSGGLSTEPLHISLSEALCVEAAQMVDDFPYSSGATALDDDCVH